ncbi:FAD-binding oxidoreductase [Microlunatus ginsengisoli]|uniref:FAD-binding oxidoreductase n=1 Tax=Microlunatus ginsengisoli TaxID=363863 RepID=A0ABP7A5Y6_9ACTN
MTTTDDRPAPGRVEGLRDELDGMFFLPGEPGYDEHRRAWNLRARHEPAAVVRAGTAEDVRRTVRWAAAAGLGVGVMATGHGTGAAVDASGILINTSALRRVSADPGRRMARVEAGAIWQDVIDAAAPHGLAGLAGSMTGVGVVGYTLGGGFGWLGRRYGLAAHSVTGAEIVTAGGDLLRTDAGRDPDLFWAIRGGTGNLGIVTALEFALHPVREVYAGNLYYPLDRARDVLEFAAEWSRGVPDELTAAITFRRFPPAPAVPQGLRGRSLVAMRGCHCGDLGQARALIDHARAALGPAEVDTFAVMPAAGLAAVSLDPVDPLPALSHSELLADLTPEAIEAVLGLTGADSPLVMFELRQLGGALIGPAEALSPLAHTSARFSLNAIGVTPGAPQEATVRAHLARVAAELGPHVTGESYLNFLDLDGATPDRIRAAYTAADLDRLQRVKAGHDPDNVFRFNRNVQPPIER